MCNFVANFIDIQWLTLCFFFSPRNQKRWKSFEEQHNLKWEKSEFFMAELMIPTSLPKFLMESAPNPLLLYVSYSISNLKIYC